MWILVWLYLRKKCNAGLLLTVFLHCSCKVYISKRSKWILHNSFDLSYMSLLGFFSLNLNIKQNNVVDTLVHFTVKFIMITVWEACPVGLCESCTYLVGHSEGSSCKALCWLPESLVFLRCISTAPLNNNKDTFRSVKCIPK